MYQMCTMVDNLQNEGGLQRTKANNTLADVACTQTQLYANKPPLFLCSLPGALSRPTSVHEIHICA